MNSRPKIRLTRRWTVAVEQYLSARYDVTPNEHDMPMDAAALRQAMRDKLD